MNPFPTLGLLPSSSLVRLAQIFTFLFAVLPPAIPLNFLKRLRPDPA